MNNKNELKLEKLGFYTSSAHPSLYNNKTFTFKNSNGETIKKEVEYIPHEDAKTYFSNGGTITQLKVDSVARGDRHNFITMVYVCPVCGLDYLKTLDRRVDILPSCGQDLVLICDSCKSELEECL